jgi:hypothetical protein
MYSEPSSTPQRDAKGHCVTGRRRSAAEDGLLAGLGVKSTAALSMARTVLADRRALAERVFERVLRGLSGMDYDATYEDDRDRSIIVSRHCR